MKPLLLAFLLTALPASAIIIEDSPDRLVFDVTWGSGAGGWQWCNVGGIGENGSIVSSLGNHWSSNPYRFLFEIRWMVDGVLRPTTVFQVTFRNNPEDYSPIPDTVLGSPWLSLRESEWCLPIPGNPHGARIVRGLPLAVPEGGDTMTMALMALLVLAVVGRALEDKPQ